MSRPPVISGKEMIAALERIGYERVRQKGSHVRMRHDADPARQPVTVPLHKELTIGVVRAILADAGISVDQLRELMR